MRIGLSDLPRILANHADARLGCLIDTNILFAASFPLGGLNEWAEEIFDTLDSCNIPVYTNINIRSEFIDLNRRVLIPEGLVSLYDEMREQLDGELDAQLRSLKTLKDRAAAEERTFKFNDQQIKKFRCLLSCRAHPNGTNAWELFCRDYLNPFISTAWEDAVRALNIKFVGTRAIDNREFFENDPTWENMVKIIGQTGVGSSDAMILNLFFSSRFPMIVTADEDVAYSVERLAPPSKYVLAP